MSTISRTESMTTLRIPLVRMVVAIVILGIGIAVGQTILNLVRSVFSVTDIGLANLLAFVLVTPAVGFAYWIYVHFIEKRNMTELGLAGLFQEFGLGALTGFGLFSLVIAILWLLGAYHVSGIDFVLLPLIGALAAALVSAFAQELIFRAVVYRITEEWLGTWWAVGISAFLFGLIHLSNSGATLLSAVAIALQAGVLLAAAYALTHRLWLPLAIHAAWDFANDGIFGVGVAGQSGESIKGLLRSSLSGPDLLTGGALGVEASIVALSVALLAGIFMLWKVRQTGMWISRAGNRSP